MATANTHGDAAKLDKVLGLVAEISLTLRTLRALGFVGVLAVAGLCIVALCAL